MWSSSRRAGALALLAGLSAGTAGCVEVALREGSAPMDYSAYAEDAATRATEGAIWPGRSPSGSFLFFDRKARGVGDLVTVQIVEDMRAEGSATTALQSSSTLQSALSSDVGLASLVGLPIKNFLRLIGIVNAGIPFGEGPEVNIVDAQTTNDYDGDGKTERSGQFEGEMTCRVVDVLPGGLLHIRGRRYVVVNHEAQFITLEGLVRREDISINNVVPSTALAEARITYDGLGVVDDKQRPGLLARVFDWIYPF